jgi:signal transduction histidine kinase
LPVIDQKAAKRAVIMRELVDKTIDDVRNMAYQLRPGVLDDLGLLDALESLIQDFKKRSKWECTFQAGQIPELEGPTATAVYRIVQEALTNALRHAQASKVRVAVYTEGKNDVVVQVADNGVGFDFRPEDNGQGFGLTSMQERANLVGGRIVFQSGSGRGTQVIFRIPLDAFQEVGLAV